MEETESLLEKGTLGRIEQRLGNLETRVEEILSKGDEFNEATQEKLEMIQGQLEKQASAMRKLRRNLSAKYSPLTILCGLIVVVLVWVFVMYNVVHK